MPYCPSWLFAYSSRMEQVAVSLQAGCSSWSCPPGFSAGLSTPIVPSPICWDLGHSGSWCVHPEFIYITLPLPCSLWGPWYVTAREDKEGKAGRGYQLRLSCSCKVSYYQIGMVSHQPHETDIVSKHSVIDEETGAFWDNGIAQGPVDSNSTHHEICF